MSFPPSFLEELRSRLPMSNVVGKRLKLIRAGREYKACCPFHNEKSPSFYVNDDKQFFHCFGCGAHGDVINFAMRHDRLSFPEAVESLAGQAGMAVPQDTPVERERYDHEKRLYQLLDRTTAWFEEQLFTPVGREALAYLKTRGLNDDCIRRFRIGYAPNDGQSLLRVLLKEDFKIEELVTVGVAKKAEDRHEYYSFFRNRVIFPVGDRKGRTIAFGGRVLGDGEPKYLNSPDHPLFHKGKMLYGLSRAREAITQGQPIIVVEGYMDVITLVEAGYSGAVAPLGTAVTEDQLTALWKLLPAFDAREPSRDYCPILCFDGDTAGQRAATRALERALPLLTPMQTLRIAFMPEGQDPDDLIKQAGRPAMDGILRQAKPMIDVIWDMTQSGRQLRTPEERGAFIAALQQRVMRIGNEHLRQLYQDDIRKRLNVAFDWRTDVPKPPTKSRWKGKSHGGGRNWQPPEPAPHLLARKQPLVAQRLRERAFLALIINHPSLFEDFGEEFAHINFSIPEFEALRQRVVEILSLESHEPLDAAELYRHLSHADASGLATGSGQAGLAEVLSDMTYMHAGFARPDRPLDQARAGWKSIWHKHLQEQLQVDLQLARRRYTEEASDENLTRLMALRGQVEALMNEPDDISASETA